MTDLVILYLLMLEKTKETLKPGNINIIEPPTLKKRKKRGSWGTEKKRKKSEWMFSRREHATLCKGG